MSSPFQISHAITKLLHMCSNEGALEAHKQAYQGKATGSLRKGSVAPDLVRPGRVLTGAAGTWKLNADSSTRHSSQLHTQSQIKPAGGRWSHCDRCGASVPSCLFLRNFLIANRQM